MPDETQNERGEWIPATPLRPSWWVRLEAWWRRSWSV